MKIWGLFGAIAVSTALITAPASAADISAKAPVYSKAPIAYDNWSPWMIRVRALGVLPRDGGTVDGAPALGLAYSDAIVPELDITYFFTKNIAAELILGVTKHDIFLNPGATRIGSTWLLPPTVTLQYHFTDFGAFKPYVGVGVNYTIPFSTTVAGPATALSISNGWGVAAQVGFDYMFNKNWGFNVDVKKLWLDPTYSANIGGAVTGHTHLDPWLVGVGLTYRFGGPIIAKY
jgi:outer membrane protein